MKVVVVGAGYVGLANALLLAKKNVVVLADVSERKVNLINKGVSPIQEKDISEALNNSSYHIRATTYSEEEYPSADFVIISVPTNFNDSLGKFDTSIVKDVVTSVLNLNDHCSIVIKSTIPIGFCKSLHNEFPECKDRIMFSPEFLREGNSLHDCRFPSRIVVGGTDKHKAFEFAKLYNESVTRVDTPIVITGTSEAEAIKLFSNSYLAMRVAYFNELDTYAEHYNLNSKDIIEGVCYDPRIMNIYNNPSFGYGGYCFPKDTKQLKSSYEGVPNSLITSIVESNIVRKKNIVKSILSKSPKSVGVYKLSMKSGSDNCRESAIISIMEQLAKSGVKVIVYEPHLNDFNTMLNYDIIEDFEEFKTLSDIIITNRFDNELNDVKDKVYTRDVYRRD